jgi:hypothetical protein
MKKELIIIHCSDSDNKAHDDISVIDEWHKERGFLRKNIPQNAVNKIDLHVGYQYFIQSNGNIQIGRDEEEVGAHTEGFNSRSIGICLHGKDFFTKEQFDSCKKLIPQICARHNIEIKDILPHKALNKNKSCPRFDIYEKIIYDLYN